MQAFDGFPEIVMAQESPQTESVAIIVLLTCPSFTSYSFVSLFATFFFSFLGGFFVYYKDHQKPKKLAFLHS